MRNITITVNNFEGHVGVSLDGRPIGEWQWIEPICDNVNYEGFSGTNIVGTMKVPRLCADILIGAKIRCLMSKQSDRDDVNLSILDENGDELNKFEFLPPCVYDENESYLRQHRDKANLLRLLLVSYLSVGRLFAAQLAAILEKGIVSEFWWMLSNIKELINECESG
jgi:hypothetical protein